MLSSQYTTKKKTIYSSDDVNVQRIQSYSVGMANTWMPPHGMTAGNWCVHYFEFSCSLRINAICFSIHKWMTGKYDSVRLGRLDHAHRHRHAMEISENIDCVHIHIMIIIIQCAMTFMWPSQPAPSSKATKSISRQSNSAMRTQRDHGSGVI